MIIINDRDWQCAIMLLQAQASDGDHKYEFANNRRILDAVLQLNYPRYDRDMGKKFISSDANFSDFVMATRCGLF